MPIEIRELIIKVNVNEDQNKAAVQGSGAGSVEGEKKEALIQEAVEEVLRIIENKKER
jgi:hypothetical protein